MLISNCCRQCQQKHSEYNRNILMIRRNCILIYIKAVKKLTIFLAIVLLCIPLNRINAQSLDSITTKNVTFKSEGVNLAGTIYEPKHSHAALVIVHGSGQETRMIEFAELLAKNGISVLTYDKRGIGESGGIYAGPEVGTNNISSFNLNLLAKDASAAVNTLH